MGTPNYENILDSIVGILQNDSRLSGITDRNIFFGNERPDIALEYPFITVELLSDSEIYKTMPDGKDSNIGVMIRVYDEVIDYKTGIRNIQNHIQDISDVLQANRSVSGTCYQSNITRKDFVYGTYDSIPVIGAEIAFNMISRFSRAI